MNTAGYIIRCAAGSPELPAYYPQGKFLAWIGGHFIPCCRRECAKRYDTHQVARAVATRAEKVFPGARFEVEAAKSAGGGAFVSVATESFA